MFLTGTVVLLALIAWMITMQDPAWIAGEGSIEPGIPRVPPTRLTSSNAPPPGPSAGPIASPQTNAAATSQVQVGLHPIDPSRSPSPPARTPLEKTSEVLPSFQADPRFVLTNAAIPGTSAATLGNLSASSNLSWRPSVSSLLSTGFPRPAASPFEIQVALARLGFSPGSIDGVWGGQTRAALIAWQSREGIPPTGQMDAATRARLTLSHAVEELYTISSNDLADLQPTSPTWLGKSQQTSLGYETILESLAERRLASPALLQRMNPGTDWAQLTLGGVVALPSVAIPAATLPAVSIRIRLGSRSLAAFDASERLIAHYPCSIARKVEKRPLGRLYVLNIAVPPNYTFDPENFPESAEARALGRKLTLPPGPNSPVGTAWIGLDRPGYGIHGTPRPEEVGRTESHGCFRLANWNAEHLARLVRSGIPVEVEP